MKVTFEVSTEGKLRYCFQGYHILSEFLRNLLWDCVNTNHHKDSKLRQLQNT